MAELNEGSTHYYSAFMLNGERFTIGAFGQPCTSREKFNSVERRAWGPVGLKGTPHRTQATWLDGNDTPPPPLLSSTNQKIAQAHNATLSATGGKACRRLRGAAAAAARSGCADHRAHRGYVRAERARSAHAVSAGERGRAEDPGVERVKSKDW